MLPPVTSWPPKRLMPSRCPCESRPFVEEPPPFLCAMTHSFSDIRNVRIVGAGLYPGDPESQSSELNIANFHGGIILPVPARDLVLVGLFELQHRNFLIPPVADDFSGH